MEIAGSSSDFNVHYLKPAGAGDLIREEKLPKWKVCMNKPQQQYALIRMDYEGPFITACSFNFSFHSSNSNAVLES